MKPAVPRRGELDADGEIALMRAIVNAFGNGIITRDSARRLLDFFRLTVRYHD